MTRRRTTIHAPLDAVVTCQDAGRAPAVGQKQRAPAVGDDRATSTSRQPGETTRLPPGKPRHRSGLPEARQPRYTTSSADFYATGLDDCGYEAIRNCIAMVSVTGW